MPVRKKKYTKHKKQKCQHSTVGQYHSMGESIHSNQSNGTIRSSYIALPRPPHAFKNKVPFYSSGMGLSYSQRTRAWVDPWEANPSHRFTNNTPQNEHNDRVNTTICTEHFTSMGYLYNASTVSDKAKTDRTESTKKFGAWDGVMAGCLLNIFGVIMFLRVGWIVGQCGIIYTIVIMAISSAVTILTTLSMSAICTNGSILAGGAYYIISRTLGPAFGGSVGILLSFGNMLACSMYLIGFAETLVENLHDGVIADGVEITHNALHDVRIWSNIILFVVLILALIGLKYVIKAQIALLVFICIAILAFFIGSFYQTKENAIYGVDGWSNGNLRENLTPSYVDGYDFWRCLAIFFPAVTGIMAGANISGDLKNPSEDIPKGTLSAICISSVVYMALALCVGAVASRSELVSNVLIMADICVWDYLIYIGIYAATLSSAIACLVGAPRILMAIAEDNIIAIPGIAYFAHTDADGNPIRGYFLSFGVAFLCNCVGELNLIAPLIAQLFIIVYLIINFASFVMEISSSPGWRPSFAYFNRWTGLLGAISCLSVMFLLDWVYALLTTCIAFALYLFISWKDPGVSWGGVFDSVAIFHAYRSVLNLGLANKTLDMNSINWRPSFLLIHFTQLQGDATAVSNHAITRFVETLYKRHSLIFAVEIMIGDYRSNLMQSVKQMSCAQIGNPHVRMHSGYLPIRKHISSRIHFIGKRVNGFCNQIVSDTYRSGVQSALQMCGLGVLRPNTLIIPMKEDNANANANAMEDDEYVEILRDSLLSGCGVMICCGFYKINWDLPRFDGRMIDLWWMVDDGGLILLLPYIMCLHSFFRDCRVRINLVADADADADDATATAQEEKTIKELICKFRLDGTYCDEPRIIHVVDNECSKRIIDKFEKMTDCEISCTKRQRVICRWLRLCELIHQYSCDSSMVIVTLPIPTTYITATQYMAILQLMSDQKQLPPMIIMRGNGQQTLTFHSE